MFARAHACACMVTAVWGCRLDKIRMEEEIFNIQKSKTWNRAAQLINELKV